MCKLIESTFVTVDGVLDDPHVWGMPYWDEEHNAYNERLFERAEALLLGRETFEFFAGAWSMRAGDRFADRMNAAPKHVASRTWAANPPAEIPWNGTLLEGDVPDAVAKLKAESEGDLLKYGTGELDKTLLEHDLIDELHLWVFPVVAGSGQRILDGLIGTTHFGLADTNVFASDIIVHVLTPREQPELPEPPK